MRKDEMNQNCPATLGEYRKLAVIIAGGPDNDAVKYLDERIAKSSADELVAESDAEMRGLLFPKLDPVIDQELAAGATGASIQAKIDAFLDNTVPADANSGTTTGVEDGSNPLAALEEAFEEFEARGGPEAETPAYAGPDAAGV